MNRSLIRTLVTCTILVFNQPLVLRSIRLSHLNDIIVYAASFFFFHQNNSVSVYLLRVATGAGWLILGTRFHQALHYVFVLIAYDAVLVFRRLIELSRAIIGQMRSAGSRWR